MAHSQDNHLLMNPPCEVRFAGWASNTRALGYAGWDISIEDDKIHLVSRMILRFKPCKIVAWAECREFDVFGWRQRGQMNRELPVFDVRHMSSDLVVQHMDGPMFPRFTNWADTEPVVMKAESIYQHPLFLAKEAPKAEELIVEPEDVMALLERIKTMQSPEQAEIRKRMRREQPPTACATILTFGA